MSHKPLSVFERKRTIAAYWYNKSCDLRGSAATLWYAIHKDLSSAIAEECGLGAGFNQLIASAATYLMVCGLSLELLYKAACVAKGKKVPHIHSLHTLARTAGITVKPERKKILDRLTANITWAGKYPVPETADELETFHKLLSDNAFWHPPDHPVLKGRSPKEWMSWKQFNEIWIDGSTFYEQAENIVG